MWHNNSGTTSAYGFFLTLSCSAIIISREIIQGSTVKVYLPFLTGSLTYSYQTKVSEKDLNFTLALEFDWAVGTLESLSEQGNRFDGGSVLESGKRENGQSPRMIRGQR